MATSDAISAARFVFAISLIGKAHANDWPLALANVRRSLNSISRSSDDRYLAIVATNDPDDVDGALDDAWRDRILLARFDDDVPPLLHRQGARDKEQKRRAIGAEMRRLGMDEIYCMFLDADDLVHRDLVDFVLNDDNRRGYLITTGLTLNVRDGVIRTNHKFDKGCGSSSVPWFRHDELPESHDDVINYYALFRRHADYESSAYEYGRPLDPVPFPAAVYFANHGTSISDKRHKPRSRRERLRRRVIRWPAVRIFRPNYWRGRDPVQVGDDPDLDRRLESDFGVTADDVLALKTHRGDW